MIEVKTHGNQKKIFWIVLMHWLTSKKREKEEFWVKNTAMRFEFNIHHMSDCSILYSFRLGVKTGSDGNKWFLMRFGDVPVPEEFPADEANMFWPHSVIKFYETHLVWQRSPTGFDQTSLTENTEGTDGVPQNIQCMFSLH